MRMGVGMMVVLPRGMGVDVRVLVPFMGWRRGRRHLHRRRRRRGRSHCHHGVVVADPPEVRVGMGVVVVVPHRMRVDVQVAVAMFAASGRRPIAHQGTTGERKGNQERQWEHPQRHCFAKLWKCHRAPSRFCSPSSFQR